MSRFNVPDVPDPSGIPYIMLRNAALGCLYFYDWNENFFDEL